MKIDLPASPINGYEVEYFGIGYDRVQRYRLKYHISATWQEVCGGNQRGADFVDEWQVFEGNYFKGRILGWDITNRFRDDEHFEHRKDAEVALRQRFLRKAKFHEEQAQEYRDKAAALTESTEELTPCTA